MYAWCKLLMSNAGQRMSQEQPGWRWSGTGMLKRRGGESCKRWAALSVLCTWQSRVYP